MSRLRKRHSYPPHTPGRRHYWREKPGRVRIKLAALLREEGYDIQPEDLTEAQGYYRIYYYDDAPRWGARCGTGTAKWLDHNGVKQEHWQDEVNLVCWDTMTACVRHGISFLEQDYANDTTEVCANH